MRSNEQFIDKITNSINNMQCKKCGKETPETKNCNYCGSPLDITNNSSDKSWPKKNYKKIIVFAILLIIALDARKQIFSFIKIADNQTDYPTVQQSTSTPGWVDLISVENNFKISFPSQPVHKVKESNSPDGSGTLRSEIYETKNNEITYRVRHTVYPEGARIILNPEDSLKAMLEAVVNSVADNKLLSSTPQEFGGYRGLDFVIQNNRDYIRERIIIVERNNFQIAITYKDNNFNKEYFNKFMESFSLLSQ